jgi:MFS family permease
MSAPVPVQVAAAADPSSGAQVLVVHRDRGGGQHQPGRALVAALAVTQTVGYGVLYYAFAVVLAPLAADLRVSTTTITGALTLAVLVSAVCAIPVGRWLDDHGGRAMMIAGSILGAFAVAAWSQVQTVAQLYVVFAGIGIASAMVLYEATFALLVAVLDPRRRTKAILTVTIVAGFASSVFVPLTGILVEEHGWRTAVLILSGIQAAVTIPLHTLALRDARSPQTASPATSRYDRGDNAVRAAASDKSFWLLTGAFVLQGAALAVMAVHVVAYLMSVGHTPTFAAAVAGLLGILSVAGRLAMAGLTRRRTVTAITATVFATQGIALAGLI